MKKAIYRLTAAVLLLTPLGNTPVVSAETGSDAADPVQEKRVLVVFEDDVSEQEIDDKVEDAGGKVTESYEQVPIASAEVTEASLDELMKDPEVKHVEEDILVSLSYQSEDWGIQKTNTPAAWNSGFTGDGVKVAVVDSGIAAHSDLHITGGVSTVEYTTSYNDDQGHGTHVAGVIAGLNNSFGIKGVAHEADIYAVKAFNAEGQAYLSDLIEGVDWAITNDMDIINLSAGTPNDSNAFHSVIDKAYASGILVVAAAGNSGTENGSTNTVNYPARYDSAIGVGAIDQYNRRASFSSVGPAVEIAAPGVRVLSTYTGGRYAYSDGTSMATPYVTGVLALMKEAYPDLSNKELRALLAKLTKDLGPEGRDTSFGNGLLQAASFEKVVVPPAVTGLKLSLTSIKGLPGDVKQLSALAAFDDGTEQDLTNEVTWSSGNSTIATVSAGRVELKSYGSTVLYASYGGKSASVTVDVPEPNPTVGLTANKTTVTGTPGQVISITASAVFRNGTTQNVTSEAQWLSANNSVATVASGRIELEGYGTTTIMATYDEQAVTITVNVPEPEPEPEQPEPEPNPVVDLDININSITGKPGDVRTLSASALFADGKEADVTSNASWSSSNTAVATVTDGRVELEGYGSATLRAVYDGQAASVTVSVPEPEPEPESEEPEAEPEPEQQATVPFTDVAAFYAPAVEYLVRRDVTNGLTATEFGVYDNIKRVDAAVWLAKELELDTESAPDAGFTDVPARGRDAVNALKEAGIISGKTANTFGAYDLLTRGEIAIILQRAYRLSGGDASVFEDVSSRYETAVAALVANGVTDGLSPTRYGVTANVTRGQLAVFLYRLSR